MKFRKALLALLVLVLSAVPAVAGANPFAGMNVRVVIGSTSTAGDSYLIAETVSRHLAKALGANMKVDAVGAAVALDAREVEIDLRFTADSTPVACLEAILAKLSCHTIMNLHLIFNEVSEEQQNTSIREIIRLIDAYDCRRHVAISGNRAVLLAAARCAPDITRCLLPETMQPDIVEQAIALGCRKIRTDSQCFTSERIAKAHANGIRCYVTNLNDPADLQAILARGLDAVCTDRFTELQKQLNAIINKGSERS